LGTDSEWVLYNEFVLTTKNYIRTVTSVRPEWLLDIAPKYYNIEDFKKGDMRTSLQRTADKMRRKEQLAAGKR
jgi:pre-mRNA-splicing factor ATP-dependent RNA helicase DHX15/PRP43